ncbi:MAG: hypothetical protein ACOCVY_00580 [Patescibacteria group bacterium]
MKMAFPMIIGVLLLVNLANPLFKNFYSEIFTGNYFLDPFLGAIGGSVSFGIPLTSYIAGGELLAGGVSLLAVSAFILAWTTVGLAMLPVEISYLGKKFALWRNVVNFFFAIIVAVLTIATLNILGI